MYDHIGKLAEELDDDTLIDVFSNIAVLNNTPMCKDWVELLGSVGVEGFLSLVQAMQGRTFTLPTMYQVLFVFAAMMVESRLDADGYDAALDRVLGGMRLDGFKEFVYKIHKLTRSPDSSTNV